MSDLTKAVTIQGSVSTDYTLACTYKAGSGFLEPNWPGVFNLVAAVHPTDLNLFSFWPVRQGLTVYVAQINMQYLVLSPLGAWITSM